MKLTFGDDLDGEELLSIKILSQYSVPKNRRLIAFVIARDN